MSPRLVPDVGDYRTELARTDASQIVPLRPAERSAGCKAVAIREPGARPLQALQESWEIENGRQLEHDVHVIGNDAKLEQPRPMTRGLSREEAA